MHGRTGTAAGQHLGHVMPILGRNYRTFVHVVLSILAGLLVLAAIKGQALADETHTFVIPADDGYGTQDCLGKGQDCAQVIAAAWCEAHGLSGPLAYGRAEDIATGATSTAPGSAPKPKLDPDAFVVTCKD